MEQVYETRRPSENASSVTGKRSVYVSVFEQQQFVY